MRFLLLLFAVLFLSTNLNAQTSGMQQYLKETRTLIGEEKYAEALERCIWFHQHALEKEQSMSGVRLSFALSDWKKLGEKYPPAKKAMIDMRDRTLQRLQTDANSQLFQDLVALNRTLGDSPKSIEVFETLAKNNPEKAKSYWFYIKDQLFASKRYDLIKPFLKSASMEFEMIRHMYVLEKEMHNSKTMPDSFLKLSEKRFVDHSLELINYYLATNDLTSAKEIRTEALHLLADDRLANSIPASK